MKGTLDTDQLKLFHHISDLCTLTHSHLIQNDPLIRMNRMWDVKFKSKGERIRIWKGGELRQRRGMIAYVDLYSHETKVKALEVIKVIVTLLFYSNINISFILKDVGRIALKNFTFIKCGSCFFRGHVDNM